jgi:S-adenosylmethionine hydrolase
MSEPIITLTTDFGTSSPYVAAMKGVILSLNPTARVVDLSHDIPPQSVHHAAFFLTAALPYFPPGTIHVVVVDPGVGTERAVLYAELATQRVLAPDNGCWTLAAEKLPIERVMRVTNRAYFRDTVSTTFHGRDIFASVAGYLSLGINPAQMSLRDEIYTEELARPLWTFERLQKPAPTVTHESITGEVVFVDGFGNLITNLPPEMGMVVINEVEVSRRVRTYGEALPRTLVALTSSFESLEVAEVQGNAAKRLNAQVGTPVVLRRAAGDTPWAPAH